ncbi:MAG: glycosyltransferase family 2 protein, partial [Chloroflexi bacterium]|nr:glycosyltransferase family 2 protein [Chloroflexota bacterium]
MAERVPAVSYFFPAHNEEANLRGLVEEALATLPDLAEAFEIIVVDDGSGDATPRIADELAAADPRVRVVHHPRNRGYGAALRSGFGAARYELLAFTDGDRQFRVADLGRLTARYLAGDADARVAHQVRNVGLGAGDEVV